MNIAAVLIESAETETISGVDFEAEVGAAIEVLYTALARYREQVEAD